MQDNFDKAREQIWQLPGFQVKTRTITQEGWSFIPQATWVVESISTDDRRAIFIQSVGSEGSQRIVVPDKVARVIYEHYESLKKGRLKLRGKRASETRKQKQQIQSPDNSLENEGDQTGNKL